MYLRAKDNVAVGRHAWELVISEIGGIEAWSPFVPVAYPTLRFAYRDRYRVICFIYYNSGLSPLVIEDAAPYLFSMGLLRDEAAVRHWSSCCRKIYQGGNALMSMSARSMVDGSLRSLSGVKLKDGKLTRIRIGAIWKTLRHVDGQITTGDDEYISESYFIDNEGCAKRATCRVAECITATIGFSPYCHYHHPDNLQTNDA